LEPFGQQASDGFGGVAVARPPVPQDHAHEVTRRALGSNAAATSVNKH
jgi:hypothetical protein